MVIRLAASRLVASVWTLLIVLLTVFFLQSLVPGDPALAIAGANASPELLADIRAQLNLDASMWQQLLDFLWGAARLDLGTSTQSGRDVSTLLAEALPTSASLAAVALVFTLLLAVPLGTVSALRAGSWLDRVLVGTSGVALAVPAFVTGILAQRIFAVRLGWLPSIGYTHLTENPWQWFQGLILPGLTLATVAAAEVARQLRGNLIDTMEQDYIRTIRAKGLPTWIVVGKHAFRNAAAPMFTVLGIQGGQIIGGSVIIESVFALPGLGSVGVTAIFAKDYPVVRGVVLVGATLVIAMNLVVDLVNLKLNPRTGAT